MAAQTKAITTREKAVVKWKGEQITVTFNDVKNLICPLATDQETVVFLKTCSSLSLNPFAKEIYLIKYSERDKAAMVIAIDSYLKSAETNDNFNGFEAGIVLRDSGGKLDFREGALILPDEAEKLVGGWARIYRKDRERPFYMAVNKAECLRYTRDGSLTKFWTEEKQPSMLRKTALKRALVEAFPSLFAGTMSTAEVAEEPEAEYHEIPEDELPPAYERNGEAYWKLWWARQKEKGLDEEKVHNMLGISSLKTDWLEQGRTLEEAEEIINKALEQRTKKAGADAPKAKAQAANQEMSPDEVEGLHIDLTWLNEALKEINWSHDTAKTWLVSEYKVSPQGTLEDVIKRLTREQAQEFVKEIQDRVAQKQIQLFT